MADDKNLINLSDNKTIDLSSLNEEDKREINMLIAKKRIELEHKATEQKIDIESLKIDLQSKSDQVFDFVDKGGSITITKTKEDSTGRTEVIMGNTDEAAKGKLSRSAKGLPDNSKWLIIGAVVVGIIAIISFSG